MEARWRGREEEREDDLLHGGIRVKLPLIQSHECGMGGPTICMNPRFMCQDADAGWQVGDGCKLTITRARRHLTAQLGDGG